MSLSKFQISCGQLIKAAVVLVFSASFNAFAQSDCDGVLKRDVTIAKLSRQQQLSWLSSINEKDYRDNQTQIDAGASFLGIGLDGSYKTFDRNRKDYLSNQRYFYEDNEALNLLVSGVRDSAINAWLVCKLKSEGIQLLPEEYTTKVVAVRIKWKPPAGPPRPLKATYQLRGASITASLPSEFTYEKELTVIFDRNSPNEDFFLTANVDGYAAKTLKIPYYESSVSTPTTLVIQRFIDTQKGEFQVIGQTRPTEDGYLVILGEWSYGGAEYFPPERCCMPVRIKNLTTAAIVYDDNYIKPYVKVPPNSEVSIRVADEPKSYFDNRSKGDNPLRALLYIGSPPSNLP